MAIMERTKRRKHKGFSLGQPILITVATYPFGEPRGYGFYRQFEALAQAGRPPAEALIGSSVARARLTRDNHPLTHANMETNFNQIAARDVSRISKLSDSIFGVAMTILMLGVRFPETGEIHGEREFIAALGAARPARRHLGDQRDADTRDVLGRPAAPSSTSSSALIAI